jgi:hypothetical protein
MFERFAVRHKCFVAVCSRCQIAVVRSWQHLFRDTVKVENIQCIGRRFDQVLRQLHALQGLFGKQPTGCGVTKQRAYRKKSQKLPTRQSIQVVRPSLLMVRAAIVALTLPI